MISSTLSESCANAATASIVNTMVTIFFIEKIFLPKVVIYWKIYYLKNKISPLFPISFYFSIFVKNYGNGEQNLF
jgi:hypothetical protein